MRRAARLLPELDRLWGVPQSAEHHPEIDTGVHVMLVLDMAAQLNASLPVRFACLTHDLGKGTTPATVCCRATSATRNAVCACSRACAERLRVPVECKELADVVAREHGNIHRSATWRSGHWCACWSAAMPSANRRALRTSCWPANAMHAGAWDGRIRLTRRRAGCHRHWRQRYPSLQIQ
jgi:tRNA nucleotidyltransferase/poly(A) polymerase